MDSVRPKTTRRGLFKDAFDLTSFRENLENIKTTVVDPAITLNNRDAYTTALHRMEEWLKEVNNSLNNASDRITPEESGNLAAIQTARNLAAQTYQINMDCLEEAHGKRY